MKIILDSGKEVAIKDLSFTDWRRFMSEFMSSNYSASKAWDVMGCVRGPDSPSERPDMTPDESSKAYSDRRDRKFKTVEVIREEMFFGSIGGCARHHRDSSVAVRPNSKQDHFDRHVVRAAHALDLEVKYEKE